MLRNIVALIPAAETVKDAPMIQESPLEVVFVEGAFASGASNFIHFYVNGVNLSESAACSGVNGLTVSSMGVFQDKTGITPEMNQRRAEVGRMWLVLCGASIPQGVNVEIHSESDPADAEHQIPEKYWRKFKVVFRQPLKK